MGDHQRQREVGTCVRACVVVHTPANPQSITVFGSLTAIAVFGSLAARRTYIYAARPGGLVVALECY